MLLDRRNLLLLTTMAMAAGSSSDKASAFGRDKSWSSVRSLINRYISERRYAGVALAISSGTSPPAFLNDGALAFGSKAPVIRDTLFRIYSVTKVFTAVLTLIMVEDGLLQLHQPVGDILPTLGKLKVAIDPANSLESRETTRPVTIEQLITHTSGLSNWQPSLGNNLISNSYRQRGLTPGAYGRHKSRPGYGPQVQGLPALIAGLAELPLIAEPGEAWNYSIGFDVMGAVVERVTGKGFATVMRDRILDPLGMSSTGFEVPSSQSHRLTTLYGRDGDNTYIIDDANGSDFLRPPGLVAGGGGLVSSASDMSRFAAMLLDLGKGERTRIAKAETIETAMRLYATRRASPSGDQTPTAQADTVRNVVLSAVGASSTMLHVDPANNRFVVFLTQLNRSGSPAEATRYRPEILAAVEADMKGKPTAAKG